MLRDHKIIELQVDKNNHLCIHMLNMPENGTKVIEKNIEYQHLYAVANDKFREKVIKNVDKNCA